MKKTRHKNAVTREDLLLMFSELDDLLSKRKKNICVTAIGGVSIILQGIRDRSTADIDIANVGDAIAFQKTCSQLGFSVDIVTVTSTVDFEHASKITLFQGKALEVNSVAAEDLIRLKLERFYKQDPEDIYAIIEKTALSYEHFKAIVVDMIPDFIGDPRSILLSAMIVVETIFPENKTDFESLFSRYR